MTGFFLATSSSGVSRSDAGTWVPGYAAGRFPTPPLCDAAGYCDHKVEVLFEDDSLGRDDVELLHRVGLGLSC